MRKLGICFAIIFQFVGCKTQDRNQNLSPDENMIAANTLLLSPMNVAMAFANHQLDEVLDYQISMNTFDTTLLDGTPYAAAIDFGVSSLGKDGHKRGGVWMIQWNENLVGEIDTVWMSLAANYADTGYQNVRLSWNNEDVYTNGLLQLVRNKNQFTIHVDLALYTAQFKISSKLEVGALLKNPQLQDPSVWDQTEFVWKGEVSETLRSSNDKFQYEIRSENLSRKSSFLKGISKGRLVCNQLQKSEETEFVIDFDPFGDEPSDEIALYKKGRTERLITLW